MTGIYEEDWSGDTDRINIRGSSDVACALGCVDAVAVKRLISEPGINKPSDWHHFYYLRHSAFVRAPTRPVGAKGQNMRRLQER